jgi:hypothetical protein
MEWSRKWRININADKTEYSIFSRLKQHPGHTIIGFTRKARTSDHMFILKCIIDQYCKTKDGRVFACFVDFQKAFDKVIHTGIKLKLLEIGVSSRFYNIIKNMYSYSTSCVKINDKHDQMF